MPIVLRVLDTNQYNLENYVRHFRRYPAAWKVTINPMNDIYPAQAGDAGEMQYQQRCHVPNYNVLPAPADFATVCAIATHAREAGEWAYAALVPGPYFGHRGKIVQLVTVVAAPTGQTLVRSATQWAGASRIAAARTAANAVKVTLSDEAAAGWRAKASTDAIAYSRAIVRVLHAHAFEYKAAAADELLMAFTALRADQRPPAAWILDGQADQVDAAIAAHQADADLVTIVRPLLKPRTRRRRVSIAATIEAAPSSLNTATP